MSICADGLTCLDTDADAQTQPSGHDPEGHVPRPRPSTQALTPSRGCHSVHPSPHQSFQDLHVTEGLTHFFLSLVGSLISAKILHAQVSHPNTPPSRFYF